MYILGFTEAGHNSAACILKDGKLLTFVEEERFTRVKSSPRTYPIKASIYCLKKNNIKLSDVTAIAIGWNLNKYEEFMPKFYSELNKKYHKDAVTQLTEKMLLERFVKEKVLLQIKQGFLKEGIIDNLPQVRFVDHHLSHAASSFYCSGFSEAIAFVIDGAGENLATTIWKCSRKELSLIDQYEIPESLGWFYASITEYLGFKSNQEEGTVMGLAPYGRNNVDVHKVIDNMLYFENGRYIIDPSYIFYGEHNYGIRFTDRLVNELGKPRNRSSEMTKYYIDIAYETQKKLEEVVTELIKYYISVLNVHAVCLSGGVAMNCKMNGVISQMKDVKQLFVQPVSDDSGTSLGAAMIVSKEIGYSPINKLRHAYWGCEFSDMEIENTLKIAKVNYEKIDNASIIAAKHLADGKIVGWFSGKSEIGARALGARSILANPSIDGIKDIINSKVKFREYWRPFAPSIISERYYDVFGNVKYSPFMLLGLPLNKLSNKDIESTIHIDNTSRPQVVERRYNEKYWNLIYEFEKITGIPAVLNTSFNVKGEPIVRTPEEALRCFFSTGIDTLFLENYMLVK